MEHFRERGFLAPGEDLTNLRQALEFRYDLHGPSVRTPMTPALFTRPRRPCGTAEMEQVLRGASV